jgi:hypothetical protein
MSTVPSGTRFIGISQNVNLTERKSAVLNAETQPYTIQDLADTIGVGAQGPQGVQGPAGPPGPVGPAGLEWQGSWVSGTSYVEDDAVGYDGASWFCILATSGTTAPDVDTTHWALLASQGADGPQGVQGPTGPQGPAGAGATQTLQQTVDLGNTISNEFEITQTINANINRFDNTFDGTFGIYGLGFFNKVNGSNSQNVELPETLTGGIKTITFPNASGTVALKTYNETVILLSYDGTSFTYTNVINELGVTITFLVFGGILSCTLSSSVLTENKTIIWASSFTQFGGYLSSASRANGTSFTVALTNTNGTNNTFPTSFVNLPIRIQVYN